MKRSFLVSIVLFLSVQPVLASWHNLKDEDFILSDPPKAGSAVEENEVGILLKYQESDRREDCQIASQQLSSTFTSFWSETGLLSESEIRSLTPLMDDVTHSAEKVSSRFKKKYRRDRPFLSYKKVKPCISKPLFTSKSYPSSHATVSAVQACLLAERFPERAQKFLDAGDYFGTLRSIVGVHYPSDVAAGKNLGYQICKLLLQNPAFTEELEQH